MPIGVTNIDSKFRRKRTEIIKQQHEFAVMEKSVSKDAIARFREEPFQLRYAREHESRTKQQTKGNIETEQS